MRFLEVCLEMCVWRCMFGDVCFEMYVRKHKNEMRYIKNG